MLKNSLKPISALWIGSLLSAGLAFLTQVILARTLGAKGFGNYSSALATISILVPFAGFGISQYWLKVFGQEGWEATRWLKSSFHFILASTIATIACAIIWAQFGPHSNETKSLLIILSLYILGQITTELTSSKLQLEERHLTLAIWQLSPHALRLFLVAAIATTATDHLTAISAAWMYSGVSLVTLAIGAALLFRMFSGKLDLKGHEKLSTPTLATPSLFETAIKSWPFGLAGIFYLIFFQSSIVIINYLSGPEPAGLYNTAFIIMSAIYLFPSVIYQKFMIPKLHRWAKNDISRLEETYKIGGKYMIITGLAAMLLVWLAAPLTIEVLFGHEYKEAIPLILILSLSIPIRFLATSTGSMLVTQELMRKKVKYMGATALANIALNLILIPHAGSTGAAISTVICEILLLIIYTISVKKNAFKPVESI